jgi:hypothetical protein
VQAAEAENDLLGPLARHHDHRAAQPAHIRSLKESPGAEG